jgi:5-methylcytosine-specific restriction endonuclease McrA
LDFDDITEQLTGERYTQDPKAIAEANTLWRQQLPSADWVIWTAPRRTQRASLRTQWNATVIVVMASLDECLHRATQARPPEWQTLIHNWFTLWEPSRSGHEQIIDTQSGEPMTAINPWSTRAGRQLRARVIQEEPTCQLQIPGVCTGISDTADHIIPRSQRPELTLVRSNLQGACLACNMKRSNNPIDAMRPAPALNYFTKTVGAHHD